MTTAHQIAGTTEPGPVEREATDRATLPTVAPSTSKRPGPASRRVTISDIARVAGVSKGAASYALNNKAGVSEETRIRVQRIADELGWIRSAAATSLSTSRAEAIGLVLARTPSMLRAEPFYTEFISGLESVIAPLDVGLLLHIVPDVDQEIRTYARWATQGRADGVLVTDLVERDPRPAELQRLGLPFVVVSASSAPAELTAVRTDDATAMSEALRYLLRLGHRRIARVAGKSSLVHIGERDRAFADVLSGAGAEAGVIVHTDFSGEAGARATRSILSAVEPATAIVFDNDVMAVAGLGVALELGMTVPQDVSLLAWDDSPVCAITHPPLSAMVRDVPALGAGAAELLLRVISGEEPGSTASATPVILPRGTTASI